MARSSGRNRRRRISAHGFERAILGGGLKQKFPCKTAVKSSVRGNQSTRKETKGSAKEEGFKMQKNVHSNNGRGRSCIHVLSGRVEGPKNCMFNYECHHCAFDQWLDFVDEARKTDLVPAEKAMDMTVQAMRAV
jgi:hypothetical protein